MHNPQGASSSAEETATSGMKKQDPGKAVIKQKSLELGSDPGRKTQSLTHID